MEDSNNQKQFLSTFYKSLKDKLSERSLRLVASNMAEALGFGGIKYVAEVSGISRSTIIRGHKQSEETKYLELEKNKQRCSGGGRKNISLKNPKITEALEALVSPYTRGDPMNPLKWTTKSLRKLSLELAEKGFSVSYVTVGELLEKAGYTLQSCKKSHEGTGDPDRNAQFEHISKTCLAFFAENQPVISVDGKKKEAVGNFKNNGREYQKSKTPLKVNAYDYINDAKGKAVPYGIYDIGENQGFVNVGMSADTGEFAVNSIRSWWINMGHAIYPDAHSLYINADGGGSNGSHSKLWKRELQKFADEFFLNVYVSHFPPATSKWNKIEHRLFSAISMNWRGVPLDSFETIVSLIANTTNKGGLKVQSALDTSEYQTGIKIDDEELATIHIKRHSFRPDWNYVIMPEKVSVIS